MDCDVDSVGKPVVGQVVSSKFFWFRSCYLRKSSLREFPLIGYRLMTKMHCARCTGNSQADNNLVCV